MNSFRYCLQILSNRNRLLKGVMVVIISSIVVLFLQFLSIKESAMVGSPSKAFFMMSKENFLFLVFLYILPLLSAFIYGDIYYDSRDTLNYVTTRIALWKINLCHCVMSFFLGFLLCFLFLSITFAATYFIVHADATLIYANTDYINYHSSKMYLREVIFPSLYVNAPNLRVFIYIILFSLYTATCSLFTYVVSLYVKNKAFIYTSCFIVTIIMQVVIIALGFSYYPQRLLEPHATAWELKGYIGIVFLFYTISCITLLIGSLIYNWRVKKYELY